MLAHGLDMRLGRSAGVLGAPCVLTGSSRKEGEGQRRCQKARPQPLEDMDGPAAKTGIDIHCRLLVRTCMVRAPPIGRPAAIEGLVVGGGGRQKRSASFTF